MCQIGMFWLFSGLTGMIIMDGWMNTRKQQDIKREVVVFIRENIPVRPHDLFHWMCVHRNYFLKFLSTITCVFFINKVKKMASKKKPHQVIGIKKLTDWLTFGHLTFDEKYGRGRERERMEFSIFWSQLISFINEFHHHFHLIWSETKCYNDL